MDDDREAHAAPPAKVIARQPKGSIRRFALTLFVLFATALYAVQGTYTSALSLYKPAYKEANYTSLVNANFDLLDATGPFYLASTAPSGAIAGDCVYISAAGTVALSDADASGTAKVDGLVYSKPTSTSAIVLLAGRITGMVDSAGSALTAGSKYYLSGTSGKISTTAGAFSVIVGVAIDTSTLRFRDRELGELTQLNSKTAGVSAANTYVPKADGSGGIAWSADSGAHPTYQYFTASGTYTTPAGVVGAYCECWGNGGGGSGTDSNAANNGAGGGGGEYTARYLTSAQLGASQTVTIQSAASGGSSSGGNGGSPSANTFGALLSCAGGSGASGCTGGSGANGGAGGTGGTNYDTRDAGGPGDPTVASQRGGRGGNAAKGGGGAASCGTACNGVAGTDGGGGGGGCGASKTGGNGGVGKIKVTEYY